MPAKQCLIFLVTTACTANCSGNRQEASAPELEDSLSNVPAIFTPIEGHAKLPSDIWPKAKKEAKAGYYFLLAEYLRMSKDPLSARPFYQKAWELDPNEYFGIKQLRSSLVHLSVDRRMITAKKMVLKFPKNPQLRLILATLYHKEQKFSDAMRENSTALLLDPKNEQAWMQKIIILQQSGKKEGIIEELRQMCLLLPYSIFARMQLSRAHKERNQLSLALKFGKQAWELQKNNPDLLMNYAWLKEMVHGRAAAISIWYDLFQKKMSHQEFAGRTKQLLRLFGSLEASLRHLSELSKTSLGSLENIQVQRVFLFWALKQYPQAILLTEYLAAEFPYSSWLSFLLGEAYLKNGDFQQARLRFLRVSEQSAYYVPSRIKVSTILQREKKPEKALEVMLNILASKYASWETYLLTSRMLANQKKNRQAIKVLDQGYKKHPLKIRLLFLRGVYEEKAGLTEECINTMRQVIAREPGFSSAYNYLGYLFAEQGENLDEAERLILKALELKPDDGYYLDSLAWVYVMQGNYTKAIPLFFEALKRAPGEGVIMEHIGDAYRLMDQPEKAREYYQKALEQPLEEKDKRRIQSKPGILNQS